MVTVLAGSSSSSWIPRQSRASPWCGYVPGQLRRHQGGRRLETGAGETS